MRSIVKIFVLFILLVPNAFAVKFEAATGGYSFSAKTSNGSGSIGGVGIYRIAYYLPVLRQLEAGIGYTFMASQIVTGDLGFGYDLSLKYFLLSSIEPDFLTTKNSVAFINPKLRPFVGIGFYQRQFQSVGTAYGGVGIKAGSEFAYNKRMSLISDIRYVTYVGPESSEATEISIVFGIALHFL